MELQKEYIQNSFSRASSSYDSVASIQKECATKLVSYLKNYFPKFYPHSILDLGTGTGYIPEILFCSFPGSKFTLNDISPNMLAKAKKKLISKKVEFILGDMEVQDFCFHDLIISNLALQWVNDLDKIIKKSYENSGIFAFSCLLDGTFSEWSKIFIESSLPVPTHQYPSRQELESHLFSLNPSRYFCDSQELKLEFSSSSNFMRYLRDLGANYSNQTILSTDLKKIIKTYTGKINITYKVFFGVLSKCRSL
ncbi:MAG: malonyl-ACP O-methyltransferase BioC [Wolbachia sp.]|nr:malonyl-ACP O-methyltransferase BioC [Wolbachia sp.]MDD9336757.1 malonyl-ACP O-methyltransferase BioC [Wolbachia sp.]